MDMVTFNRSFRKNMKRITILLFWLLTLATPEISLAADAAKTFTLGYTRSKDIVPNTFTVKSGEKVRLEIIPSESGAGCMSSIMVPGLWEKPQPLIKGKKIVMEFTPQKPGAYKITCAMGVQRGVINVQ